jgi:hypothetical protein
MSEMRIKVSTIVSREHPHYFGNKTGSAAINTSNPPPPSTMALYCFMMTRKRDCSEKKIPFFDDWRAVGRKCLRGKEKYLLGNAGKKTESCEIGLYTAHNETNRRDVHK